MKVDSLSNWISTVSRFISRTHPLPSDDIEWDVTTNGWRPRLKKKFQDSGANSSIKVGVPAQITSKETDHYLVKLFENGIDMPYTQSGIKLYVLQLNYCETLPVGTWVIAMPSAIGMTGGGNV